jgi:hypothetical protein
MGDPQWLPGYCPVWLYPMEKWQDEATALGHEHEALRAAITNYLTGG